MVHLSGDWKMYEFLSEPHSHCHLQISFADAVPGSLSKSLLIA